MPSRGRIFEAFAWFEQICCPDRQIAIDGCGTADGDVELIP